MPTLLQGADSNRMRSHMVWVAITAIGRKGNHNFRLPSLEQRQHLERGFGDKILQTAQKCGGSAIVVVDLAHGWRGIGVIQMGEMTHAQRLNTFLQFCRPKFG